MAWAINKQNTTQFLRSDIDSSGMSVIWTTLALADKFEKPEDAKALMTRTKERYPKDDMRITEVPDGD